MGEKVIVLMERFYKVPEQTENEKELYVNIPLSGNRQSGVLETAVPEIWKP